MAEHRCTYTDPAGQEVLAHCDERHVVLPAEVHRRLLRCAAALERLVALRAPYTQPELDAAWQEAEAALAGDGDG